MPQKGFLEIKYQCQVCWVSKVKGEGLRLPGSVTAPVNRPPPGWGLRGSASTLSLPPNIHSGFVLLHAFMTKKNIFLLFPCFFFKVITEQVVVDANLPSVSKESVGQVGAGRPGRGSRVEAAPPQPGGGGVGSAPSGGGGPGPEAVTTRLSFQFPGWRVGRGQASNCKKGT